MKYYNLVTQDLEVHEGFLMIDLGLCERGRLRVEFANARRNIQVLKNRKEW